ncbi:MAG: phage baseplate protein [Clostridia bacterium]
MAINKIVYDGDTLIDLTGDTVTPETLAEGATAHNKSGEQIIGTMVGGSPTEIVRFWRCEDGQNYLELWAVAQAGIVWYYAVICGLGGLKDSYTGADGTLTDLKSLGSQYLPAVTLDGSTPAADNYNATFIASGGNNASIRVRLTLLNMAGSAMTDISINTNGDNTSYLVTPGVICLGMCKNQEAQPSTLAVRASASTPDVDPTQIYEALYPVGSIKMWYDNADHSTFLGFKWERCLAGRAPVGINPSEAEFASIGQTGGEKTHALTTAEIPPYSSHGFSAVESSRNPRIESFNGNGQPHNNLQPYEVIAPWRRIS